MTAADRRRAILEALSSDKFTTRANLAFEFGVSKRTIDHDLLLLSRKYPIYAIPGKGGGIHVMENFRLDGRYLTEEQMDVLEELYAKYQSLPRYKRKAAILKRMRPYFKTEEEAKTYVEANMQRKLRNLISRRIRMMRKVNLQDFNFFVTLTFNSELHTEESFKAGVESCLRNFCNRRGWKYIGVWERSPKKKRLHFHGIFYIPEGTMPGRMLDMEDYNFRTRRRQITHQNTYFNEKFGRSDFEPLDMQNIGSAIAYIVKYLEKTGEKIVYSKGLPQFFVSDVMDEDVVCPFGLEDKKLLLYDDFLCWDEGVLVGAVSKEVINRMPKEN